MYEALSGTKPFSGSTPWEIAHALGAGQHRPLGEVVPGLPPRLVETVERAMSTDPESRFATADDMTRALDDTTAGETTKARPEATVRMPGPPAAEGVGQRLRRRGTLRRWAAAAAAAASLVLVAAVWLGGDRGGESGPVTPPTTGAPAGSIPAPLDRAIDELEESVRP